MESSAVECYIESTTVTLEWTLSGLRTLFESSKGEAKSKVMKSVPFGRGRWQILFYANSGSSGGPDNAGHVSLYLSCEPTIEEREAGANGKWAREGSYNFMFQIRPPFKGNFFNQKEARDRVFSSKNPNLGWGTFAHRDLVYYHSPVVRNADAFVITCTITSGGTAPAALPTIPKQLVPRGLMNSIASLLDDPLYSDVEFIFPGCGTSDTQRRIYAASKLLRRCDYFDSMFSSGFMEGSTGGNASSIVNDTMTFSQHVDDSDSEDQDDSDVEGLDQAFVRPQRDSSLPGTDSTLHAPQATPEEPDPDTEGLPKERPRIELPLSPRRPRNLSLSSVTPGPRKMSVVVRDSSYWTYRAMINWIYTDSILFAPLSSSFVPSQHPDIPLADLTTSASVQTPAAEERGAFAFAVKQSQAGEASPLPPQTRKEWVEAWERTNPGRPRPCSAKSIYRLADRLDLSDLKDRAFQHIIKSLTTSNIAFEVFSDFSATYEEVRKPMMTFFLDNWSEVRSSDAMTHVWQQLRLGSHPGFEEVWPLIVMNLEFRTQPSNDTPTEGINA